MNILRILVLGSTSRKLRRDILQIIILSGRRAIELRIGSIYGLLVGGGNFLTPSTSGKPILDLASTTKTKCIGNRSIRDGLKMLDLIMKKLSRRMMWDLADMP